MNRYQLAKLVSWAEELHARKRLQKVVYLLQAAGCPLGAEFMLHHYGPYSQEVARLSDEMVRSGLLAEQAEQNPLGQQYSYRLTEHGKQGIAKLEATEEGGRWAVDLAPFEGTAKRLLAADLKELEAASTMVYFQKQGLGWEEAVEKTCEFKSLTKGTNLVKKAEVLARQIVE